MASPIAIDNARVVAHAFDVRNHADIALYIEAHNNWKLNAAVRAGCTPPLPPEPEPLGPELESLDQAKAADIFDVWAQDRNIIAEAWQDGDPTMADTQPDYTPAITVTRYTLPATATPTPIPQPARPLGIKMGPGKFAPALGDKYPVGHVWTNPEDDVAWLKVEAGTMGGDAVPQIYWQRA